jgi:hypothetical protein
MIEREASTYDLEHLPSTDEISISLVQNKFPFVTYLWYSKDPLPQPRNMSTQSLPPGQSTLSM